MNSEINKAVEALRRGGLILYPTDTVWGIGCDACNEEAVRKVFALKKRPGGKSLVLLAGSMDMIRQYVEEVPPMAGQLVEVNDAPMTIIYPGAVTGGPAPSLAPSCVADDGSVGIRIPSASRFCIELLSAFGRPIVSTSANLSGEAAPKNFDEMSPAILAGVDYVVPTVCGGPLTGVASQIIKVTADGCVKIIRG